MGVYDRPSSEEVGSCELFNIIDSNNVSLVMLLRDSMYDAWATIILADHKGESKVSALVPHITRCTSWPRLTLLTTPYRGHVRIFALVPHTVRCTRWPRLISVVTLAATRQRASQCCNGNA